RLAGAYAARGLTGGAPVALVLPNVPAFPIAFLALLRAGAVVVPLNPHFKGGGPDVPRRRQRRAGGDPRRGRPAGLPLGGRAARFAAGADPGFGRARAGRPTGG